MVFDVTILFLVSEKGGKAGWRDDVRHLLLVDLF